VKVTAADGTRWKVGRQWWPDRQLQSDPGGDVPLPDGGGGGGSDGGGWLDLGDADEFVVILAVVGLVILAVLFFTTVVVPVIAFTIELIVVLVLFFAGLAGRLLFRRPWTVRARSKTRPTRRWQVVGFRNSGELRDEVADALRTGRELPAASPLPR
jgi:hypothetical protein